MTKRLITTWKWLAAIGIASAAGIALLMTEPPSGPLITLVADFLRSIWARPFLAENSYGGTLLVVVQATVLVVALWFAAKVASRKIKVRFLDRTPLEEGRKYALQRLMAYTLFLFGSLIGIPALGLDLGSLAVFSGALGIGVGLGFQTIAKNFASGLILLFEQQVKVGDRIEVGTVEGEEGGTLQGDIVSIGSRATLVRTNDNVVIVVPNSEFIEQRVTNLTLNDRTVRISLPVGVSYDSDPEQVRDILINVGTAHPDVQREPRPNVIFAGFGDSSLDFELRVWTSKRVTRPRRIASELYFEVFKAFKQEGIEIPFPQRDLHLRSVSSGISVDGKSLADGPAATAQETGEHGSPGMTGER